MVLKENPSTVFPKRFYTDVVVVENANKYAILLDGRQLKTLARHPLLLSTKTLADAVAKEWMEQGEYINITSLPLTRIANIAIDRVPTHRDQILADILLYSETDYLCHLATDPKLAALQQEKWATPLAFLEEAFAIRMEMTIGVIPKKQPVASLQKIAELSTSMSDEVLAAFAMLVPLLGSILLALVLWKKGMELADIVAISTMDEDFQRQQWGDDPEFEALKQEKMLEIQACARWLIETSS